MQVKEALMKKDCSVTATYNCYQQYHLIDDIMTKDPKEFDNWISEDTEERYYTWHYG